MKEFFKDPIVQEMAPTMPKVGVGFMGSFAAMTFNDWIGALVGIATLIFFILQIEAAIHKRKNRQKQNEKP